MDLILTNFAKNNVTSIADYTVVHWGSRQAAEYLTGLNDTFLMLLENPLLGKLRSELSPPKLSFPYHSHVIYYNFSDDQLIVYAVLHKSMVPKLHLD